jgi:hypothetical protein
LFEKPLPYDQKAARIRGGFHRVRDSNVSEGRQNGLQELIFLARHAEFRTHHFLQTYRFSHGRVSSDLAIQESLARARYSDRRPDGSRSACVG